MVLNIGIKTIIIGDLSVGKTSILLRYTKNQFTQGYIPTIGADFTNFPIFLDDSELNLLMKDENFLNSQGLNEKSLQILNKKYENETNKIFMWDLAGQPNFKKIRSYYMTNAFFGLIILDLSNPKTYDVSSWIKELGIGAPDCDFMIAGNKSDLLDPKESEIKIKNLESTIMSKYNKLLHIISAKSGDGVKKLFSIMKLYILNKLNKVENS